MLKIRSEQKEIIDNLGYNNPTLIENLKDMEKINHWLGFNKALSRALKKIKNRFPKEKISLADLGCGSGDSLRYLYHWARSNQIALELHGIDANQFIIEYAKSASLSYPTIQYHYQNIFLSTANYDILTLNNICHHFTNDELINLLKKLKTQIRCALIINDLHRHLCAYWGFYCIAKFLRLSEITKHDGALSVKRGFTRVELINILHKAGIEDYQLRWDWMFRWQIIILKQSV